MGLKDEIHKDGWGVRVEGPEDCTYFEGERTTGFSVSISASPRRLTTLTAYTPGRWREPYENEIISPEHWTLIKERLTAYFKLYGGWEPFVVRDHD